MKKKPTLGVYSFTGCAGCQLALLDCEDQLLDLFLALEVKVFYEAMSNNDDQARVEVALVEGSINTEKQLGELMEIRAKSNLLVAFGSCAHHGCVQGMGIGDGKWEERFKKVYGDAQFTVSQARETQPLHELVRVDAYIPGCPPSTAQMLPAITQLVRGNLPTYYNSPVCLQCKFLENECLLYKGIFCLGTLTIGGCGAPCPSQNMPCVGCWGIIEEANHPAVLKLLKDTGYTSRDLIRRFRLYGGSDARKLPELLEAIL